MMLFSGIYRRMYRSFKEELNKCYKLNQLYLENNPRYISLVSGKGAIITKDDYKPALFRVIPSADPQVTSEAQRQAKALLVKQAAATTPGYNTYLVEKEFLEANDISNIDALYPDPEGPNAIPAGTDPQLELDNRRLAMEEAEQQINFKLAIAELQQEADLNAAKITELHAKAEKILAEANGADVNLQISAINAQVGAAKAHQEGMAKILAIMQKNTDQLQKKREKEQAQSPQGSQGQAQSATTAPQ